MLKKKKKKKKMPFNLSELEAEGSEREFQQDDSVTENVVKEENEPDKSKETGGDDDKGISHHLNRPKCMKL